MDRTVTIDCPCPGAEHPDDTVTLRESLDFRAALTARNAVVLARGDDPDISAAEILTLLTEVYVLHGVESWTLVDAKRKPLAVTRTAIREHLLSDIGRAMAVGEKADELYAEAVMLPLLREGSRSSRPSPTGGSTSATTGSAPRPLKPSKPSSTTSTRTDGITAMSASPAGASS